MRRLNKYRPSTYPAYQAKLRKVVFPLLILYALANIVYYKFIHKPDKLIGSYFAYHVVDAIPKQAIIIWDDRDCALIDKYNIAVFHPDSIASNLNDTNQDSFEFIKTHHTSVDMDTTGVGINESVQLVGSDCDSTVGIILFKNRNFHSNEGESKFRKKVLRGMISLKDLHSNQPN